VGPRAGLDRCYFVNKPSDKIEKNQIGGACSTDGAWRGVYRILVGKPERKRSLGRPRCRWEGNIKMDLQKVGSGGMD
jgi:hypothetical protein